MAVTLSVQRATDSPDIDLVNKWTPSTGTTARIYRRLRWLESTVAPTHAASAGAETLFESALGPEPTQQYCEVSLQDRWLQLFFYWRLDSTAGNPGAYPIVEAGQNGSFLPPNSTSPWDDTSHDYLYSPGARVFRSGIEIVDQTEAILRLLCTASDLNGLAANPKITFRLYTDWDTRVPGYVGPSSGDAHFLVGAEQTIEFPSHADPPLSPEDAIMRLVHWSDENPNGSNPLLRTLTEDERDYLRCELVSADVLAPAGDPVPDIHPDQPIP